MPSVIRCVPDEAGTMPSGVKCASDGARKVFSFGNSGALWKGFPSGARFIPDGADVMPSGVRCIPDVADDELRIGRVRC